MESDSESQDSDDGRRFRFEATRKDSVAPVDTADRTNTSKKKSKHKSSRSESSRHYRTDRKERSKHESGRNTDEKDLRYSVKYSRHESKSSRQEDDRNSYKDYREGRDASAGSTANDRGYRNSNEDVREKVSRDSKRQSDRDRNVYQMQRSREHSYERNHHNERASSDKHRSRYHERHKHHSRDRSRDRAHQSSRSIKSSNGDYRSREEQERHDTFKKTLVKENRSQNSRDGPKNVEPERSYSEVCSSENTKEDSSIEIQDCKDLDLSEFDVLSETGENISDGRDSGSRMSSPCLRKTKQKRHDSEDRSENCAKTKLENDGDEASGGKRWEQLKVKRRNYDLASSSTNNNPSAVSDSLLGSSSSATFLVMREILMDPMRKKTSEHYEEMRMIIDSDSGECSNVEEKYSQCHESLDETQHLEKNMKETESVYGPVLPSRFASNTGITDGDKLEKTSSSLNENKIDDNKRASFIGPCLPPRLNNDDRQNEKQEDGEDVAFTMEADTVFGPALPPHLLQRQQNENNSRDKVIGPVLPDTVKSHKEASAESSDDDGMMGPLPIDHPALRNSRVHEQLDLRAQRIRHEGYLAETDLGNKREEWMTDLPSAQAVNLGLGPRKFRLREGPDMSDRSCWTDTPAQKAQKQKDLEAKRFKESDTEHVKKEFYKKEMHEKRKPEKSLLEMHQSKIAKKKKKEEKEAKRTGISMRRPFDRDIDLQVNRFDQAQKKTILMKAQLLDDRFSHGQI